MILLIFLLFCCGWGRKLCLGYWRKLSMFLQGVYVWFPFSCTFLFYCPFLLPKIFFIYFSPNLFVSEDEDGHDDCIFFLPDLNAINSRSLLLSESFYTESINQWCSFGPVSLLFLTVSNIHFFNSINWLLKFNNLTISTLALICRPMITLVYPL